VLSWSEALLATQFDMLHLMSGSRMTHKYPVIKQPHFCLVSYFQTGSSVPRSNSCMFDGFENMFRKACEWFMALFVVDDGHKRVLAVGIRWGR